MRLDISCASDIYDVGQHMLFWLNRRRSFLAKTHSCPHFLEVGVPETAHRRRQRWKLWREEQRLWKAGLSLSPARKSFVKDGKVRSPQEVIGGGVAAACEGVVGEACPRPGDPHSTDHAPRPNDAARQKNEVRSSSSARPFPWMKCGSSNSVRSSARRVVVLSTRASPVWALLLERLCGYVATRICLAMLLLLEVI